MDYRRNRPRRDAGGRVSKIPKIAGPSSQKVESEHCAGLETSYDTASKAGIQQTRGGEVSRQPASYIFTKSPKPLSCERGPKAARRQPAGGVD
jgi:hypothetical protein